MGNICCLTRRIDTTSCDKHKCYKKINNNNDKMILMNKYHNIVKNKTKEVFDMKGKKKDEIESNSDDILSLISSSETSYNVIDSFTIDSFSSKSEIYLNIND